MIIFHTKLNIADNSGGRFGQCIKVLKGAYASIGNIVVVVIKELRRTIKQKKIVSYQGGFSEAYETMKVIELIYKSK